MSRSHVFNLKQSAIIKGNYCFDNVEKSTVETIAAARIWRNLGLKAAQGYAAKRGLNMSLVRLACQLEAMQKHSFMQQKNGKIINRRFWSDDDLTWYWVGSRKPENHK